MRSMALGVALLVLAFCFVARASVILNLNPFSQPKYIHWLEKQSLLYHSKRLSEKISGHSSQWQYSYAFPQSEPLRSHYSVWLQLYPASVLVKPGQTMSQLFTDNQFWNSLDEIGIKAVHLGPIQLAGSIVGYKQMPTQDGWFDRISLDIDPRFMTNDDYQTFTSLAAQHSIYTIGDVIPGHTGMGMDFLLAERNYKDYPGIYDMIEIKKRDWNFLPHIQSQWIVTSLNPQQITELKAKGYIPGRLQRQLFSEANFVSSLTEWGATGVIQGVDGKMRRWVFLHYFKPNQPTMNWLDPSFSAERIIAGQIIENLKILGDKILRLDANAYLGIEQKAGSAYTWSEDHPLTISATDMITWLIRKLGGFSYQEFNSDLEALQSFSGWGADLSYDFISRPAVEHALLTGDATFLRLMLHLGMFYHLLPNNMVHDMQNHDDLTYELPHFLHHSKDTFLYHGASLTGEELRHKIIQQMQKKAMTTQSSYNQITGNGLCATFAALVTTRLGYKDIHHLTDTQRHMIQKGHLLLVLFNAMQPGIFSISAWDLVGALPLDPNQVKPLLVDQDWRWLNRGGYDLLGGVPKSAVSAFGVPRAEAVYGPIPQQLRDPHSFASEVKKILAVRDRYEISNAEEVAIPEVKNDGSVILIHRLPHMLGYEITALNFGDSEVDEEIDTQKILALNHDKLKNRIVMDLLANAIDSYITDNGTLRIHLTGLSGKILFIK